MLKWYEEQGICPGLSVRRWIAHRSNADHGLNQEPRVAVVYAFGILFAKTEAPRVIASTSTSLPPGRRPYGPEAA